MTDRDALYAAILANPDDDTPRLVFADYLEENGEAEYAAFIRKQIELARLPEWDPVRLREEHLNRTAINGDQWYSTKWYHPNLPEELEWSGGPFRRGFPAALTVRDLVAFRKHAPKLFGIAPIEEVEVWSPGEWDQAIDVRPLTDNPWLARIHRLRFSFGCLDREGVERLQRSPYSENLADLDVVTGLGSKVSPGVLFLRSFVTHLTRLAVHVGEEHTASTLAAIRKFRGPHCLRKLRLTSCDNSARPDLLCESGFYSCELFDSLTELDLSHNTRLADALPLLLRAPFLDNLESLRLNMTQLGPDTQKLIKSLNAARIRQLDLSQNDMKPKDVQVLAKSPNIENLRVLNLERNPIGNAGAVALAKSPYLRSLLVLDLMFCNVGDAGAQAFLDSPLAKNLVRLNLYSPGKNITPTMKRKLRKQFGARVNV